MEEVKTPSRNPRHTVRMLDRRRLTGNTFEVELERPEGFHFLPGQWIRLFFDDGSRDYSLVSAPDHPRLLFCVRQVPGGRITTLLAEAAVGDTLTISGPQGYFTYKASDRQAVFAATGTGIAPFVSMARSGVSGFILLHGVRSRADLIYKEVISEKAVRYVPCLSDPGESSAGAFSGRVTDFMEAHLPPADYDVYLCGRSEMVRDATLLADDRFPDALVHAEIFY
jgi:ferredoxin-NADP reductase